MNIKDLHTKSRDIWGDEKLTLAQMIVVYGKVFGDICRWERGYEKDKQTHTDEDLKKEIGNMIFTSIKFAGELGYSPEECIELAIKSQEKISKQI